MTQIVIEPLESDYEQTQALAEWGWCGSVPATQPGKRQARDTERDGVDHG